ncbi:cytochrome P450 [Rippkaea orientalis PCC 8801]|uniref:Cytochrome P450 n=1 Tax=Rippkaea orientalis (strain PCC 8801 / RF-1) TaxID=41431 RepID=B7JXX0_RIPO1|nr:cytochrome P450 [Rippkaea orientalis]ACK65934.1 cytochrome P450 [Rippkaea orientalis PCC 8801]
MIALTQKPEWTIPGPSTLPLIGRSLNVIRFGKDCIGLSNELFNTYGKVVSLAASGGTNLYSADNNCPGTILAYGPEIVRQVTTQHNIYHKRPLSGTLYRHKDDSPRTEPLKNYGVGLFGVNGEEHLQQRKLMMPAFHKTQVESYRDEMVAMTQLEIDQLAINQPCEISQLMQRLTLRIATKTLFGEDINSVDSTAGELLQQVLNCQRSSSIMLFPFDIPGLIFHRYLNLLAQYEAKIKKIIDDKRAKGANDNDVLSMLIQAREEESGHPLSEAELIAHTGVIFLAGHETTANALTWTMFLLSQHPQILGDLVNELESVLQGEPPTLEQLPQLPLLDRVIKESMRILTSVPWNGRVTSETTELDGYVLPKGTEVLVSIYHTHHMSEIYPDPEAFKPERWETITPSIYEYNPFSAGPRLCIGATFAMMELKIVLGMLLQRFRWQYIGGQQIDRAGVISLKPKYGLSMRVCPQDHEFNQGVGEVQGNIRETVKLS